MEPSFERDELLRDCENNHESAACETNSNGGLCVPSVIWTSANARTQRHLCLTSDYTRSSRMTDDLWILFFIMMPFQWSNETEFSNQIALSANLMMIDFIPSLSNMWYLCEHCVPLRILFPCVCMCERQFFRWWRSKGEVVFPLAASLLLIRYQSSIIPRRVPKPFTVSSCTRSPFAARATFSSPLQPHHNAPLIVNTYHDPLRASSTTRVPAISIRSNHWILIPSRFSCVCVFSLSLIAVFGLFDLLSIS